MTHHKPGSQKQQAFTPSLSRAQKSELEVLTGPRSLQRLQMISGLWASRFLPPSSHSFIPVCVSHLPLPFSRRGLGVSHIQLFITSRTVAYQALLSVDFSRQEHWSRLAFPSPGDLPNPGIRHLSPMPPALAGRFFTTVPPGKPAHTLNQDDLVWRSSSVLYLQRSASQIRSHSQVPGVETLTFLSGASV